MFASRHQSLTDALANSTREVADTNERLKTFFSLLQASDVGFFESNTAGQLLQANVGVLLFELLR